MIETTSVRTKGRKREASAATKSGGSNKRTKKAVQHQLIDLTQDEEEDEKCTNTNQKTSTEKPVQECAICLCECTMPMRYILCGHEFCLICYQEWRRTSQTRRACPVCRGDDDDALVLPDITLYYCHDTEDNCTGQMTLSPHDTLGAMGTLLIRCTAKHLPKRKGALHFSHRGQRLVPADRDKLIIDTAIQHNDMIMLSDAARK
jgi:hypothetical protein